MQAAASDLGIAFGPERAAAPYLARGTLLGVLDEWCPRWPGVRVHYPRHRDVTLALRPLLDVVRTVGGTSQ